ncbi:Os01g0843850, partial [Oryza sativa Japonica Group]
GGWRWGGGPAAARATSEVGPSATKVPEDGHRLLLRCRHDRQAQRPLLHRHERVLLLQRHRRTPASSPDSPVRFASCWLYTRGHSRSVTHTLF